jgi:transposase-like protein
MPMTAINPFKGRQYPGEVIITAVRWYLRYPLAYLHVAELLSERGLFADASCVWRWVQAYGPELNKRCRAKQSPRCRFHTIHRSGPPLFWARRNAGKPARRLRPEMS